MIDDRRGSVPFSVLAVTILLMASVAGAVIAEHARSGDEIDRTAEGVLAVERAVGDIASYIEQELGIIILNISRDDSLGPLEDRSKVFVERAEAWVDDRFPMVSGDIKAELLGRSFDLKAESMGMLQYGGEVEGYAPAYLRGVGTIVLDVHSDRGRTEQEVEISTDGSYALPLSAERGSMFERMVGGGGISISQMMSYELESLAQYRVLNGYGANAQFGSKGTESIITAEDVRNAYANALSLAGDICFRDSGGMLTADRVDLADLVAGDTLTIDRASFYGQVLMSSADDLVIKWFDYLCGDVLLEHLDGRIALSRLAIDSLINFFTGDDIFGAGSYIEDFMKEAGVKESVYRFPGSGTTTVSVGGYTVTVDNPAVDVLDQSWIRMFNIHYRLGDSYLRDMIRQILNTAAASVFASDYPPLVLHIDPSDDRSFMEQVSEAYLQLTDEYLSLMEASLLDAVESNAFYDPFYAEIAETVMRHTAELADTDGLTSAIEAKLLALAGDETDALMGSYEIQRAVRDYAAKVYADLSVYDALRSVEGSGPDLIGCLMGEIVSHHLPFSGMKDTVDSRARALMDEIVAESSTDPYARPIDLPGAEHFLLEDGDGNITQECLRLQYESSPVIQEPAVVRDKCTHVTGFLEDVLAAYSTTFQIRLSDIIDYRVEGTSSLSSAIDSSITSASRGTVSNDITIEISVASAWALVGVDYSASDTIFSDAWSILSEYFEPILEPLREILEIVRNIIDVISGCVMEIAGYVADIVTQLYERLMGPMAILAEWAEEHLEEMISEGVLDFFYSINLVRQDLSFEYLGYRFDLSLDLASLATSTKTLFSATLSGPIAGLAVSAGITVKVRGDMNVSNAFVTGKATVQSDDWKVKVAMDPLMKGSRHLITVSADIGDADITVVMPDLDDYNELGFTLSGTPGIGQTLSSIPIPGLGVNLGLDAGVSIKYSAPMSTGLIINEYESNPPGDDSGREWVELLNNSDREIDLDGYTLTAASDRRKTMRLEGSISPGEFLVVETKFVLVNSAGKMTKNGDGVTLKDPDGVVVDKTGTHKDEKDDPFTWQRSYDGAGDWEFKRSTMGTSNGSYVSGRLLNAEAAKDIMITSIQSAFDEVGSITDLETMQEVVKLTIKNAVDKVIKKVAGCFVEASVFVKVDVLDPTSTASSGIRVALRCDSDMVEDVLKYIAGKIESIALSMKNPYRVDGIAAFTDNIDLEVTFGARVQYPGVLARSLDSVPKADFGITFRTNISALSRIVGADAGTPGIECGIRIIDCPLEIIPSKLSPKKGMDHDMWLIRINVEWDR